jgi:hypothetical protein
MLILDVIGWARFEMNSYYLYRVHPVAYLQTIVLRLFRLTQLKEYITFNFVLLKSHVSTILSGHHRVNTIV